MAAARYLCVRASMAKLQFRCSSHSAARVSSTAFEPLNPGRREERGATDDVVDTAKEGVRKATNIADAVGDAAKKTLDTAWEAAKEANHKIRETVEDDGNDERYDDYNNAADPMVDEIQKLDGPVDAVEYRQMETHFKSD